MKIVYLTSVDVSAHNAPANHVKDSATALSSRHDVTLIYGRGNLIYKSIWIEGVTSTSVAFPKIRGGWRYFEKRVSRLVSSFNDKDLDLIYLRFSPSVKLARALSQVRCPKAMEVNGLEVISHPAFSEMIRVVDIVLVGTEDTKNHLLARFPSVANKCRVHSNVGINTRFFSPKDKRYARKKIGIPLESELVIHVSGFQPHHDFLSIIQAAQKISELRPSFRLYLIGDGERRCEVQRMAQSLLASGVIKFVGQVDPETLSYYICSADVCLNALTNEKASHGNGNAQKTMEYMACGRAVIETVNSENEVPTWLADHAMCISCEDVDQMVIATQVVLDNVDDWENKALEARALLIDTNSWNTVVDQTISIINDTILGDAVRE